MIYKVSRDASSIVTSYPVSFAIFKFMFVSVSVSLPTMLTVMLTSSSTSLCRSHHQCNRLRQAAPLSISSLFCQHHCVHVIINVTASPWHDFTVLGYGQTLFSSHGSGQVTIWLKEVGSGSTPEPQTLLCMTRYSVKPDQDMSTNECDQIFLKGNWRFMLIACIHGVSLEML